MSAEETGKIFNDFYTTKEAAPVWASPSSAGS
jgi:hypothetical protein